MKNVWRVLGALVALAVLGGASYAGYWYVAAGKVRATIEAWAADPSADQKVSLGAVAVSGFPDRLIATISSIGISRPNGALPWQYTAENLRLTRGLGGDTTTIRIFGPQTLTYTADGKSQTAKAQARQFQVELRTDADGAFTGFALGLTDFALERPEAGPLSIARASVQMAKGSGAAGIINDKTRFAVQVDGLKMPEYRRGALGDTIEQLVFNAAVTQPLASLDLPITLAKWRDSNGYVTVTNVTMRWGTLDMTGLSSGVLRIDQQMRVKGGMSVGVANYMLVIDAFHAARKLNQEARAAAQAAINFLGGRGANTRIGLQLEIDEGNVNVGPATLGTVGPIIPAGRSAG